MSSSKPLYKLFKSTIASKKWDVYVHDPETGNVKRVSFGASGYEDYTQHKDKERRERYRLRHKKDYINDITKPGAWSWWVLWGDSSNRDKALAKMLKSFGIVVTNDRSSTKK